MAYTGYVNEEVRAMYGIPYSQLTAQQKKILHEDSKRRAKLIKEREDAVLKNNLKAFEDEAKMEKVLASLYKSCQKQIVADVTETIAKVEKAGGTWSYANQSALTRSRGLFEQITAELNKLGQKEQITFTQGLGNIYTDQFLRQVYELGQSITVKANFNRLNPALIKQTLDYPWSGAMFSDRLWLDKERLGRNLRVGLTQSMILGEGIPEITDRIIKDIDTSRYNAERIARTETKRVTYVAHDHAYADMGVEELKYYTAGMKSSSTVCNICKADNGKIYKRGEEPTLPRHPNCKCVYIPHVPDTFGDNELNELTGSVRGAENYEKWIEANKDKINPDGSIKDGWERDWKNGGKLVNKNAPKGEEVIDFSGMDEDGIRKWESNYYKYNTPNLTKREIEALDDYGEGGYGAINGVLRYKEGSPEYEKLAKSYGADTLARAKKEAEDLSGAISKFELNDTIIVQRAERDVSHITGSDNSLEALQGMVGKTYTEKGFTSTSLHYQSKFEGSSKDAVHLEIVVPKGSKGAYIDKYVAKNEHEFLLDKNTDFYVVEAGERIVQVPKYDIKSKQFITVDKTEKYMKVQVLGKENSIDTLTDAVKADKVTLGKVDPIKLTDYPQPFYATKAEAKNTQALLDFINKAEGADPDVVNLYGSLDKVYNFDENNVPFKISHAKDHAVNYKYRLSTNNFTEVKLTIPKLSGDNIIGSVDTTLHEEMHLLDLLLSSGNRDGGKAGKWVSSSNSKLIDAIAKDSTIGTKVKSLFKEYDAECNTIAKKMRDKYTDEHNKLVAKFIPNGVFGAGSDYKGYKKALSKLTSSIEEESDYLKRNAMGGGIGNLEDIYDALSGGYYREAGMVRYGHGSSYYKDEDKRAEEILANYGTLSVAHPELLSMLSEDKPALVGALREVIKSMLQEVK